MLKLLFFLFLILFPIFLLGQNQLSCAFCLTGLAQINAKIQSTPDMRAQMGIQSSQGCDQITVRQTRQTCRQTLNTNFDIFYTNFTDQFNNSPEQMCKNMGLC
ncbi:unnamed protein product [Caenorhabditis angaria]|uniref:Saposin B-type domain-containing protein n=1 Tax=Caenorhabditis angaria TaxID=860376 RepID=A0A9P1IYF3_9PELO|nr:unnamed protein product [Caenorhabditis angaria]